MANLCLQNSEIPCNGETHLLSQFLRAKEITWIPHVIEESACAIPCWRFSLIWSIQGLNCHVITSEQYQYGFRKGIGCQDAVASFIHFLKGERDQSMPYLLTLKKAFDLVPRDLVLRTLQEELEWWPSSWINKSATPLYKIQREGGSLIRREIRQEDGLLQEIV